MPRFGAGRSPAAPSEPRPAVGPPPDGSDPSLSFLGRGRPAPIVLRRAKH